MVSRSAAGEMQRRRQALVADVHTLRFDAFGERRRLVGLSFESAAQRRTRSWSAPADNAVHSRLPERLGPVRLANEMNKREIRHRDYLARMIFRETPIAGAVLIELEPLVDERGAFARTFAVDEFAAHGLETRVVQCNTSTNVRAGTLRCLHYQAPPYAESKLVRCVRGSIFDVVVDLRPESPTYCAGMAQSLRGERPMLFVPTGAAHGFQTLEDDSEVLYQMSEAYSPSMRAAFADDPAFGIAWPETDARTMSDRDRDYADFALKRVLVTGATGFVGRQALARRSPSGFEVHAVGRREVDLLDADAAAQFVRGAAADAPAPLRVVRRAGRVLGVA
jgi:dTDP-4-dehydrorhamnose 3,5-epimerase